MRYLGYWLTEQRPRQAAPSPARSAPPSGAKIGSVTGGALTPGIQAAADSFRSSGMVAEWARRTGSDPEEIRRALRDD